MIDKSEGQNGDVVNWTEFRKTKKQRSLSGKIIETQTDHYIVEYPVTRIQKAIVHFEKVNRISRGEDNRD